MADNALMQFAQMRATPRNKLIGLLADALGGARDYANRPDPTMPGGLANPPLSMLSNALSMSSLAKTADRMSYGDPLTNSSQANVPFLKPETADALMTAAPLAMAAAPYLARGAQTGMANLQAANTVGRMPMAGQRGAVVWHGSPHKFDKFDASKIGTGEGNQTFGHGLYLAENPAVADSYSSLPGGGFFGSGSAKTGSIASRLSDLFDGNGGKWRLDNGRSIDQIAKRLATETHIDNDGIANYVFKDGSRFMAAESGWDIAQAERNLYKVDLPDTQVAKMIDWDKGGRDEWISAISQHGSPSGAAAALRKAGIPGIRYLDGGSRSAGQGSSNFVVFPGNENILKILARNGQEFGK
jgi:hypothetical protein